MTKLFTVPAIILSILVTFSCKQQEKPAYNKQYVQYILNDYQRFWKYWNDSIVLHSDFIPLDDSSRVISKNDFLISLSHGNFFPLKQVVNDTVFYRLIRLSKNQNEDISSTISIESGIAYKNFLLEGKRLPDFNFTDINGIRYNDSTVMGKVVVVNFWFIACGACKEEMPDCNKLVDIYSNRDDIVFISFATNQKTALKAFLAKTSFKYATIPIRGDYIATLGIRSFPTHLVINKTGTIVKVFNDFKYLKPIIEKELSL